MVKLFRPVKWDRDIDRRLTQWFGVNPAAYKPMWWPYHLWLDYAWKNAWDIQAIYSSEDWVVTSAWWDTTWFWNLVVITWVSGKCYYAHLSSISIKKWEYVKANQQIWLSWNTWNSTWIHLHFWWKPADKTLRNWKDWWDPTSFISDRNKRDPLVERLIREWYWNWIEWDWVTERVALLIAKSKYT